jgi:hypothetical protein
MKFNKPKLIGKNDNGYYLGKIEQIGTGKTEDLLMVSNRKPNLWVFSLFNGYMQLGKHIVKRPHKFKESQEVIVELNDNQIIDVMADNIGNRQMGEVLNESFNKN